LAKPINFIDLISSALTGGKIPPVIVGAWIVMGLLIVFALIARAALSRVEDPTVPPEGVGLISVCEAAVHWLDTFVHDILESHDSRSMVPFFGSLFLFILGCNYFGLIPGMEPPTSDSDLTFALGTVAFVYFIVQGFRAQGLTYLKSFLGPFLPLVFLLCPIEIADNLFRPFSLGIRLYANMFADHTVLGIATNLTKLVVPVAFYSLGAIVCVVQALVFLILPIAYVKMATEHQH
jgi:F-type H+-transporting ATPase subunit a